MVGVRNKDHVTVRKGDSGAVIFGPYMPLPAGDYTVKFRCIDGSARTLLGNCDIMASEKVLESKPLVTDANGEAVARIAFSLPAMTFALQFRVLSTGSESFCAFWPELIGADAADILRARGL